jgi:hypothetical protein
MKAAQLAGCDVKSITLGDVTFTLADSAPTVVPLDPAEEGVNRALKNRRNRAS